MLKNRVKAVIVLAFLLTAAATAGAAAEYEFYFHSYPNPFSPGTSDAEFAYDLPSTGSVSIYVYDLDSKLVRTVTEDYPQVYGRHEGELEWNGADDNGDYVDPGPYVIVLEVRIEREIYRDTFVAIVNR